MLLLQEQHQLLADEAAQVKELGAVGGADQDADPDEAGGRVGDLQDAHPLVPEFGGGQDAPRVVASGETAVVADARRRQVCLAAAREYARAQQGSRARTPRLSGTRAQRRAEKGAQRRSGQRRSGQATERPAKSGMARSRGGVWDTLGDSRTVFVDEARPHCCLQPGT